MILNKLNKKGAALLQVLILSTILAGMATMILRVTLSRAVESKKARHQVEMQEMIESCMAEVNMFWASKTPEAYASDLENCRMCDPENDADGGCTTAGTVTVAGVDYIPNLVYSCSQINGTNGASVSVYAVMSSGDSDNSCKITYVVPNGVGIDQQPS